MAVAAAISASISSYYCLCLSFSCCSSKACFSFKAVARAIIAAFSAMTRAEEADDLPLLTLLQLFLLDGLLDSRDMFETLSSGLTPFLYTFYINSRTRNMTFSTQPCLTIIYKPIANQHIFSFYLFFAGQKNHHSIVHFPCFISQFDEFLKSNTLLFIISVGCHEVLCLV